MGRRGWTRLATVAAALGLVPLLSGCVVPQLDFIGPQDEVIGEFPLTIRVCASGSTGCGSLGSSGIPAITGTGQVLLGVIVQDTTSLPSSFTSTGPEALTFTPSPSYAAELERLSPAGPGGRWLGFISQAVDYQTGGGPQSATIKLPFKLRRGADGAPFQGDLSAVIIGGVRVVSAVAPASRPVVCGPAKNMVYDEVQPPNDATDVWVICDDTGFQAGGPTRDLGVLNGAVASGVPGGVRSLTFAVRYAGSAAPAADFRLSATTELPGATVAVTPGTLVPDSDSTSAVSVAVGIPAGARPGRYDVTLTARLANGQARAGTGTLTVLPGAAGGPAARLRLTTILPRRLSAKIARRRGVVVLIGANKAGTARVQLFQGRARAPKASKRVRLRVPGPIKVVLKSAG